VVFSAKRPVRSVAELKGLRVRVQSSRLVRDELRAIGAVPVVAGLADEAHLLRTGQIDAVEGVPSNLLTQHTQALLPHVSVTNHRFLASAVLANETFWKGLPPDIRATLEAALAEVTLSTGRVAAEDNQRALLELAKSGKGSVYRPNAQELDGFRRALADSYRRAKAIIAPATWDRLCALLRCPRVP
jgi:C4-dicarboxylate-binding protein DctP